MRIKRRIPAIVAMAVLLTAIWYLLSGKFDVLHFGTGVLVAVVIAVLYRPVEDTHAMRLGSFLAYVPWLVWQIVLSNLRVARIVLSPTMRISPAFVRQRPGVEGARALTLLGSSITLTPGTLTVDVDGDEIFVHALDTASADDVRAGTIARRVRRVCSQGEGEA